MTTFRADQRCEDSDGKPGPEFKPAYPAIDNERFDRDPGPVPIERPVLVDLHAALIILGRALALLLEDHDALSRYARRSAGLAVTDLESVAAHLKRAILLLEVEPR
jgi:hypothetical protein